jgi:hypothetical protein
MPDANHLGDRALKLVDVTAAIGKPSAIKDVGQASHQPLSITDIRPAHVQRLRKGRPASKDG